MLEQEWRMRVKQLKDSNKVYKITQYNNTLQIHFLDQQFEEFGFDSPLVTENDGIYENTNFRDYNDYSDSLNRIIK